MLADIDLRALAERRGPERAFLSLYLSDADALDRLHHRIDRVRRMLGDDPVEQEHFEENMALARQHLDGHAFDGEALCLFACWADDYVESFTLEHEVDDLLWVDSSPYIRPLAELQDEYETFVVVTADNTRTRIFRVVAAKPDEEERVRGDVKNAVKKGGWSQQRYARRREKELHDYAQDVAAVLQEMAEEEPFDRLVLLGSKETMEAIEAALPQPMTERLVGEQSVDVQQEEQVWDEAFDLFFQQERDDEQALWEQIKGEYLRGGRAVAGAEDVLEAAAVGRVEAMIVTRDVELPGQRCRQCENLHAGEPEACPVCGADDLFHVDLVNELVELLAASSARTEFADPITGLSDVGDVAALLRY